MGRLVRNYPDLPSAMILTWTPTIVTVVANDKHLIETDAVTTTGTDAMGNTEIGAEYHSFSCNYDIISSALARCYYWMGSVLPTTPAVERTDAPELVPVNTVVYLATEPVTTTAMGTSSE
jgi:hypothetical protein